MSPLRSAVVAGAVALAVAIVAASPAAAAGKKDPQGERMAAAFNAWVVKWGVQNASMAAFRGAKKIGSAQVGSHRFDAPQPVASLSKAITGVCVAKLVEARALSYGTKIGKLVPAYFKANKPKSAAAKNITVGELLTHTSGMSYDPTQGAPEFAALDFTKKNMPEQLALALARPLGAKTYFYNNVNYDALGMIVEAKTGRPYEAYCGETVLKPAGVKGAALDPARMILSSYGAWRISALDYARFLDHFRPGSKLLKSKPPAWPKYAFPSGSSYTIGTYQRESQSSYNFWHSGAFFWSEPARAANFGAYFAMYFQNARFVATYSPQPPSGAVSDLDVTMYNAANAAAAPLPSSTAVDESRSAAGEGTDRGDEDVAIGRLPR